MRFQSGDFVYVFKENKLVPDVQIKRIETLNDDLVVRFQNDIYRINSDGNFRGAFYGRCIKATVKNYKMLTKLFPHSNFEHPTIHKKIWEAIGQISKDFPNIINHIKDNTIILNDNNGAYVKLVLENPKDKVSFIIKERYETHKISVDDYEHVHDFLTKLNDLQTSKGKIFEKFKHHLTHIKENNYKFIDTFGIHKGIVSIFSDKILFNAQFYDIETAYSLLTQLSKPSPNEIKQIHDNTVQRILLNYKNVEIGKVYDWGDQFETNFHVKDAKGNRQYTIPLRTCSMNQTLNYYICNPSNKNQECGFDEFDKLVNEVATFIPWSFECDKDPEPELVIESNEDLEY